MAEYKWRAVCPGCGEEYRGRDIDGGHCTECHRTFTSDSAADKHRVGVHGVDRHCVDVMNDYRPDKRGTTIRIPWRLTNRGWTPFPEREFPARADAEAPESPAQE